MKFQRTYEPIIIKDHEKFIRKIKSCTDNSILLGSDNFLFSGEVDEHEFILKKKLPRPVPFGPVYYGTLSNDNKILFIKSKPNPLGYVYLSIPTLILMVITLSSFKIMSLLLGLIFILTGGFLILLVSYWIDNLRKPSFIERINEIANA